MKRKQKDELRAKSKEELKGEVLKKEDEVMNLKIEVQLGRIKNTTLLRRKMDEIAVMKTIVREKELEKEASLKEV
ncbi:50S ribosomal protein L29 [Candidatus Microgenomates bacterium]|jgi:ribosomal protein L29|nr:MAG: 50S ribosomal protein L29 [Candidatus Microgenomates bacterium]